MPIALGPLVLAGLLHAQGKDTWGVRVPPFGSAEKQRRLLDCNVQEQNRGDCGFQGITERGCRSRGCCYERSDARGIPFCFYSAGALHEECFPSDDDEDCGWEGISGHKCRDQGCCYGARGGKPNATCFRARAATAGLPAKCTVPSSARITCGFGGITPEQCAEKGCCYFHSTPEYPACYYALGQAPPEQRAASEACAEIDEERVECGYAGMRPDQCSDRGCCYAHAQTPGVPFCFYKKGMAPEGAVKGSASEQCVMSDLDRVDCGFQGVTPEECRGKGCCYFHSHAVGSPFCFFKRGGVPLHAQSNSPECLVDDDDKVDCDALEIGITPSQCQAKGCCYHGAANSSVPDCYFKEIPPECQVAGSDKEDCGFRGISPVECRDRGCCYAHSTTSGAPLCFHRAATARRTTTPSRTTALSTTTAAPAAAVAAVTARHEAIATAGSEAAVLGTTSLPGRSELVSSSAHGQPSTADCSQRPTDPSYALHFRGSCDETSARVSGRTRARLLAILAAVATCLCLAVFMFRGVWSGQEGLSGGEESVPLKGAFSAPKSRVQRLIPGSPTFEDYEKHFWQKWDTQSWPTVGSRPVPLPKISGIYEINAEEQHVAAFKAKQKEIDNAPGPKYGWFSGNQKTHFHGARMKCDFQGTTCMDMSCVACRIIDSGSFASSALGGEMHFRAGSHAAKGQGLAPGKTPPPESLEHFVDRGAGNAVFIADVLQGTPQIVSGRTQGPLPEGMHSRIADKDASNGVDEVVIFDAAQALPKALITF